MIGVVRSSLLALVAALMLGAIGAFLTPVVPASGQGQPAALEGDIRQSLEAYFAAVMSRQPDTVASTLAPEFQILRADGSTYDARSYPGSELPVIAAMPAIANLKVSSDGDVAIATYEVNVEQTRDGKTVEVEAPRLTVFRNVGGKWLVSAHANFAAIEE